VTRWEEERIFADYERLADLIRQLKRL